MTAANTALTLRLLSGLNQRQASELIGVSLRTWKAWESDNPPMKASKAEAFKEAVLRMDKGVEAPDPSGDHIRDALARLAASGRASTPPWYPEGDFWGQKSGDAHRRAPDAQAALDSDSESESEVLADPDISQADLENLVSQINKGKYLQMPEL